MRRLAAVCLAALLCAACAGAPVRIDNYVPPDVDRGTGRVVEGSATGYQFMLFIPLGINDRHARAFEELKKNAGDAWITNVQEKEGWTYLLIGTAYTATFRATAYPKNPAAAR
jgi:hypothetical protein